MAARDARNKLPPSAAAPADTRKDGSAAGDEQAARYQPLPTGTHGLDPELVRRDQRERLQKALVELVAEKGYAAVRIIDLAKLAHVSQPTFYSLFADKENLLLSAYEQIAARTARTVIGAYETDGTRDQRVLAAMRAFAELAAAEPDSTSLLVLGAFGAGTKALERRRHTRGQLERGIYARDGTGAVPGDLTLKFVLGGIREVAAARLRDGRAGELGALASELSAWAACYPGQLPEGLDAPATSRPLANGARATPPSERARRAEGRLPSGRSDLPRQFIVKSQRERIVDATAAIVAEKGLAALTIPEIARRANVSHQTFYAIYASKDEAFLGAQKVGMHQALRVAVEAYEARAGDWPSAVAAGTGALIDYLASEPAHAHLTLVDTFAASPAALQIRDEGVHAFAAYLMPGYELASGASSIPPIAAEAIAGGIWQVLYDYIDSECVEELPGTARQVAYLALVPFLGSEEAAVVARQSAAALASA
jgi:AcrR family transcriptional regulator